MIKRLWNRFPRYAWAPMLAMWAAQFQAYYFSKVFAHRPIVDMALPIDSRIPLVPGWILPYVGAYVYWIAGYGYLCAVDKKYGRQIAFADVLGKTVAALFFILLPTTFVRPDASGGGVCRWMVRMIYALDEPRNLFPSLHCFCSWIIARGLMPLKQVKPWVKFSAAAFSLLVCASTLFTRQHLFLDVPGGILLAEGCLLLARLWGKRRKEA